MSKRLTKWAPDARTPITQALHKHISKNRLFIWTPNAGLVNDSACDDVLQRLAPYLRRNPPLDILDLWPATGAFSSKMNEFLRPRRHILIEPSLDAFRPFLVPLANSKPCYTLLSEDVYRMREWDKIFAEHLPEQTRQENLNKGALLPKNDTLLVVANPPPSRSKGDHNTPGRWWGALMDSCLSQSDLNRYGSVRIIATMPTGEVENVLPRQLAERKRLAFLTENVALHAFDIASTKHPQPWTSLKPWQSLHRNIERAEARREASGITTPAGRELPKLVPAPQSPELVFKKKLKLEDSHQPRVWTDSHTRWTDDMNKLTGVITDLGPKHEEAKKAKVAMSRIISAFRRENKSWFHRQKCVDQQLEIDRKIRELSRAAADPGKSAAELKALDDEIGRMTSTYEDEKSQVHFKQLRNTDRFMEDARAEEMSDDVDGPVLLWDRRPFNALTLNEEDVYPYEPRSIIYFEADTNPVAKQYLQRVPESKREQLLQLFDALSFSGTSTPLTVQELSHAIFPGRSANDLVRAIPSLVPHAGKRLKPGSGPVPLADPSTDPTKSFQENIDYDLSDVRIRTLPVNFIWELLLEYQSKALDLSTIQFTRLLGGTMTMFRDGQYVLDSKGLRLK